MNMSAVMKKLADKLAILLELPQPSNDSERTKTIKMALLVLTDAAIYYNMIGPRLGLEGFDTLKRGGLTWRQTMIEATTKALDINYEPVFELALIILEELPNHITVENALEEVKKVSDYIASSRALLRHDLMGRIYHRLLFQKIAKHLATYYTSVPAAHLLARLVVNLPNKTWNE